MNYTEVEAIRQEFDDIIEAVDVLTPELVTRCVEIIKAIGEDYIDDEVAHVMEDELHQAVLKYVASVSDIYAQEMAGIALTTSKLKFARWCA